MKNLIKTAESTNFQRLQLRLRLRFLLFLDSGVVKDITRPKRNISSPIFFLSIMIASNVYKSDTSPVHGLANGASSRPELTDDSVECSRQRCNAQVHEPGRGRNFGQTGLFGEPEQWLPGSCWGRERRSQCIYVLAVRLRAVLEICWSGLTPGVPDFVRCWSGLGTGFWNFFASLIVGMRDFEFR